MTILSLFEKYAADKPASIAIRYEQLTLTYELLNQQANQFAHYLGQFNLPRDTLIAISMPRSPELLITILGVLKSGCAWLPLDDSQPIERLQSLLSDARPALLITQSDSSDIWANFKIKKITLSAEWNAISNFSKDNMKPNTDGHRLAYVIYTSGSTGRPKGVLIEHASLLNYVEWFREYSACQEQERIDFSSNYIFDMAITTSVAALALGLQVVICPDFIKKNISEYLTFLNAQKINITKLTPSYFRLMLHEVSMQPVDLADLRAMILGGENLLTADAIGWLSIYPNQHIFNEYGPTETTVAVTQFEVTSNNMLELPASVPIGKPGTDMICRLLTQDLQATALGETGELYVGGKCLARGYLNRPDLSEERFPVLDDSEQRWYKTGDWCRYLPNGQLEFCGRVDDQIKILGYRIEPGEIEACLQRHPRIKQALVMGQVRALHQTQLVAYCLLQNKNDVPGPHVLRHYIKQHLADYMIPANFVMMTSFPLTANGKVDKNALPVPVIAQTDSAMQPMTVTEQALVDIWQEEFHLNSIGVNHDFFALGGHSLLAARIASLVARYLHKQIHVQDIYKAENIRVLAMMVEAADASVTDQCLEPVRHDQSRIIPLSDFQFIYWISHLFEPKVKKLNLVIRKRLSIKLDMKALSHAFESLFKKHEILFYQVSSLFPYQRLRKNCCFQVIERDFSFYSTAEQELLLTSSLNDYLENYTFNKREPMLAARLFYLDEHTSELQICLPHTAFDDVSENILFAELSNAYLQYTNDIKPGFVLKNLQYKDYVLHERNHLNRHLEQDIQFWQAYLHDAALLTLPASVVVTNMGNENNAYSSYLDMPDDLLPAIHALAAQSRVSVADLICAAITLSLKVVVGNENKQKIVLNMVKSARSHESFDNMIGCFLQIDPMKVDLNAHNDLLALSRHIQALRVETSGHQQCSGMVKLA